MPNGRFYIELSLEPLGQPHSAGMHPDQVQWLVGVLLTRAARELPVDRFGVELKHR